MSDSSTTPPAGVPRRRRRGRTVAVVIVSALALVIGVSAAALYLVVNRLDANITTIDVAQKLGKTRPTQAAVDRPKKPLNILLMGSDTREGQDGSYGSFDGPGRSDTTILLHVAADRKRAIAVSIPRDLWTDLPLCTLDDGRTVGGYSTKFNAAFAIGGPACTIKAVEQITDVFINHYMVVDFDGFKQLVDALDGVEVCMEEPVDDSKSGLVLPAGISTVRGEQALAFVRARKSLADGSDTARIARQQEFLSSMVRKGTSAGLLRNPVKLVNVLDAATSSLTTDPGLGSVKRLGDLASQLRDIRPDDITFVTAPSRSRGDGANVELIDDRADELFAALRGDTPWPPPTTSAPTAAPGVTSTPTKLAGRVLTASPSTIQVRVLNGSTVSGRAARVADELRAAGFDVVEVRTANRTDYTRSVIKGPAGPWADEALRTLVASTRLINVERRSTSDPVLTLVVADDVTSAVPVLVPSAVPTTAPGTAAPTPGQPRTAADRICSS
jgi:LCP family protein required for cell wall assembly